MIKTRLASLINGLLKPIGIQVVSNTWMATLTTKYAQGNGLIGASEFKMCMPENFLNESLSQRGQDLIAFFASGGSTSGFFVEIGGADGLVGSNTYLLEKIGWEGLVVEPARVWKEALERNRSCSKDFRAVYGQSGLELQFIEKGELSTLARHRSDDYHVRLGPNYLVRTVIIDYSSVDIF